jgi:nucleotide-binding universal stress UspA family protein
MAFAKELQARTNVQHLHREVVFSIQLASAANALARNQNAEFVVVGNRGKSGGTFFGSNTLSMIKHSAIPVLAVPRTAPIQAPKQILFADDLTDALPRGLGPLRRMAQHLQAHVIIGHVQEPGVEHLMPALEYAPDMALAGVAHSTHHVKGDLLEGLDALARKHHADMIAVLHRHLDLITRLLHPSTAKLLAREIELPLLVLQEPR